MTSDEKGTCPAASLGERAAGWMRASLILIRKGPALHQYTLEDR